MVRHVAHFNLTPVNRNFRPIIFVIINFTDKIWLFSFNIGSYLLSESLKKMYLKFSVIFGENYYNLHV